MSDPYAGQGGSYIIDENGNRVLVDRTEQLDSAGHEQAVSIDPDPPSEPEPEPDAQPEYVL